MSERDEQKRSAEGATRIHSPAAGAAVGIQ
jgi:hypothetical protein